MGIGQRRQIELVQHVATQRTNGTNATAEGDRFKTWAQVSNLSTDRDGGNGQVLMGQLKRFDDVRFRFNKFPGMKWSVNYDGREWTVTGIVKKGEKRFYWTLTAQAKDDVQG